MGVDGHDPNERNTNQKSKTKTKTKTKTKIKNVYQKYPDIFMDCWFTLSLCGCPYPFFRES